VDVVSDLKRPRRPPLRFRALGVLAVALASTASLVGCGGSDEDAADREPIPAPKVSLAAADREVWAPLPPDRTAIPVLVYHGVAGEADFADEADAAYGVDPEDFAKQMTLMHHAGFRTISLAEFDKFINGEDVDLPARPVLLTFDDARLDSWTATDATLRKLGFRAVMFVDAGRVADGVDEYLTWDELRGLEASGRWELQVHSGRGHVYLRYGLAEEDTGPAYAYEQRRESFEEWQERVFGDIAWGEEELAANISAYRPLAFAPPYGAYGQDGTNDERIPGALLDWLTMEFGVVFTQDRDPFAKPGAESPLGRFEVTRAVTGGDLYEALTR